MGVQFLPSRAPFLRGPSTVDVDVTAWAAAVVTNGGTVSNARKAIVAMFVQAEKAAGTWALTDDCWGLWAENAIQALTSLKQRRLATLGATTAAPAFTADRGYAFDGVDDILTTGFVPSTHAVAMTVGNGRLAIYDRVDVSSNNGALGTQNGSSISLLLSPRAAANIRYRILDSTLPTPALPVATALGFTAASRTSATVQKAYRNGVALADGVASGNAASLPNISLTVGTANSTAVFRQTAPGFACIGAQLSDAQEAAQYANVQAWATAIGANV